MVSAVLEPFEHIGDCRMIDRRVPIRTTLWSGTGTVVVPSADLRCMMMWLLRLRTSVKPCFLRIAQTSWPERMRSLAIRHLDPSDVDLPAQPLFDFLRGCGLEE